MTVLLVFGLFVVLSTAHNITFLDVPQYGDPRSEASLVCNYVSEPGDPALHSVKWYRGKDEIFRYTPGQHPSTRSFNTSADWVVGGRCDNASCSITVPLPRVYNSQVTFVCEVSAEGPRFAVVKQEKILCVAVVLKEDPVILGVPSSVQVGEEVVLNCTTSPAMPPANIVWYIDGKPEKVEPWLVNKTQVSAASEVGLRRSWRALRLRVSSRAGTRVRCEATQPTWPPYVRVTDATLELAHSPLLSMFTASGKSSTVDINGLMVTACFGVYILYEYSALCDLLIKLPHKL